MPTIALPDGSTRCFDAPVTVADIAADIGPGLAKAALGGVVDGVLVDCSHVIADDSTLAIVTGPRGKDEPSEHALYLMRHSAAHVMAEAIEDLFPGVSLVYGPPVEGGFYYDMAVPDGMKISSDDFDRIEARMAEIMGEDRPFTRHELPVAEGMARLESEGSKYKIDNGQRAVEGGADVLSWYATGTPGEHWGDLCRGPHVPSTGRIGAAKIMRVAASYWHGDADSDQLTRVYGTAFPNAKRLAAHLEQLEEARRRDHRVVGRKLELFAFDDLVGPGLTLWKPRGAVIRETLQTFIGEALRKQGYDQVFTPHVGKLDLYRTSGHFPYYADSQFPPLIDREQMKTMVADGCTCGELANRLEHGEIDGYLLKPMNCPHHIRIFASEPRSYRDLPVRLAEFGTVYRWEQSGELGGLLRVRGFTQDDAHLFCTEDQVHAEVLGCLELVQLIFGTLGIEDFEVRVGLRDEDSSKYVGDPANWERAEAACQRAAEALGVQFTAERGEAAFYGPKIDFIVKDTIGRRWQLGTVQVDYNLPERFDLTYTGADNAPHRPVMIHRAPFGSMERFVGFLIEHFDGAFPAWLAPEQVRVLPVSEKSVEWADVVERSLREAGVRVTQDVDGGRLPNRIREAAIWKVPYVLVVGPRDAEAGSVSVRVHGIEKDLGAVPLDAFVSAIEAELNGHGTPTASATLFQAVGTGA